MGCGQSNAIIIPISTDLQQSCEPKNMPDNEQGIVAIKVFKPINVEQLPKTEGEGKENQAQKLGTQEQVINKSSRYLLKTTESKSQTKQDKSLLNDIWAETIGLSPSKILCPKAQNKELKKQRKNKKKKKQLQPIQKQLKRLYGL